MGTDVVGNAVGDWVGTADVGVKEGDRVGLEVVGKVVGEAVGLARVGDAVGESVGADDVGDHVRTTQVWPGVVQSPSEHRWVGAQEHLYPLQSSPLHICSQIPKPVLSQPWMPSLQACLLGASVGENVGAAVGRCVGWKDGTAEVGHRVGDVLWGDVVPTVGLRVGAEDVGETVGRVVGVGVAGEAVGSVPQRRLAACSYVVRQRQKSSYCTESQLVPVASSIRRKPMK